MRILLLTAMIFLVSTAVHGQSKANQSKNEASEFMLMQKAADDAENKKDLAMLDRLLTDDYIFTAPGGTVIDKKQLIAEVRKNAPEEGQTVTYDDAKAHIYGKAAVVNYLSIVKGRDKDGKEYTNRYRNTVMWVKQRGHWRMATIHVSRIRP